MKMYEKMGMDTEAALKWIEECKERKCLECVAYPIMLNGSLSSANVHGLKVSFNACAAGYLLAEIPEPPKVPRWQTAKTQEDFDKLFTDYFDYCGTQVCRTCKYSSGKAGTFKGCYHAYLSDLVDGPAEVPQKEGE